MKPISDRLAVLVPLILAVSSGLANSTLRAEACFAETARAEETTRFAETTCFEETARAEETARDEETARVEEATSTAATEAETGASAFLWKPDPEPRGMFTFSYAYASDSEGPGTRGYRLGYGYVGAEGNDYPWAEWWLSFRESDDTDITAAGLSVVPAARLGRRFGVGPLFDLGVSRHRYGDRSSYSLLVGAGVEGVVRISQRWDWVTTLEAAYRTPSESELQIRGGLRFHHPKLRSMRSVR